MIVRALIFILLLTISAPAFAQGGGTDSGNAGKGSYEILPYDAKPAPNGNDCSLPCNCTCRPVIQGNHKKIRQHMTDEFIKHRNWMIDIFFTKHVLPAMAMMTSQLSTVAVQQVQIIGTFFDAKHQLETQRLMQQLMAEAHKDYQPSEGLCEIGTNVRSLAASSRKSDIVHVTFANRVMGRQLRNGDMVSASGDNADIISRIELFKKRHCNVKDNGNGLNLLCEKSAPRETQDRDINFTQALNNKLTLDIDFSASPGAKSTDEEMDIFALTSNLFAHTVLPVIPSAVLATDKGKPRAEAHRYMDLRSIAAKRSVAQDAIAAMVAERAKGDKEVAPFMKKLVTELGVKKEDIDDILGKEPSYFAQMEVLTKDIYQNPTFYTELYDKPANVLRKSATIRALNLMQERDLYKSQIRNEAILAVILETMLADEHSRVNARLLLLQPEGRLDD